MYNEELKNKYVDECGSKVSYTQGIFHGIEKYEEIFGKDAGDFLADEIEEVLKSFISKSIESLRVKTSILRRYTDLYIANNLSRDGINHYDEITNEILEKCVNKYVKKSISYNELKEYTNELINDSDRFLLNALWYGFCNSEELLLTKAKDIKGNEITLSSNRVLKFDNDFINLALNSAEEDQVFFFNSNSKFKGYYVDKSFGYIMNPRKQQAEIANTQIALNSRVRKKMVRIQSLLGIKISCANIRKSGMAYYINRILEKNNLTFYEAFDREDIQEIIERYGYSKLPKENIKNIVLKGYLA